MKRFFFLCIFIACTGFSYGLSAQTILCENHLSEKSVEIDFSNPKYIIQDSTLPPIYNSQQVFSWVNVLDEEFGIVDSVGMPCLPKITFSINLPNNAVDIDFVISDSSVDIVSLKKQIIPYQSDFSAEDTHTYYPVSFDQIFYGTNSYFVNQRVLLSNTYKIRDKLGISVTLFPYMYNPGRDELRVLKRIKMYVKYRLDGSASNAPASSVFEDYFASFFKNYTPVTSNLEPPRYLIVTPTEFNNHLQSFVDYKQSLGFNVDVIPIEPAVMSSATVKSVIQTRYNDERTRPDFVLLIGNSFKLPPAAGNPAGTDENDPVTDFPYVQLEGGTNDFEADAFIGRWPINAPTELQNIIRKTIYMEMNMQQLDKRALFISGADNSWWPKSAIMEECFEVAHEYAIDETFEPEGYTCEHRYQPYLQTVETWMAWNPLIFAYSGHGSITSMGPVYNNSNIVANTISGFNNKTYPMVFSFACKTGNFATTSNIGIEWIKGEKGGMTFLGSSVNTLNTSDVVIEKKIFGEAFFDANKRSIGKVIALGMRRYREYFWTTSEHAKRYSKSYNLLGDPSFLVRGTSCPPQYVINEDYIVVNSQKEYHASESIEIGDVFIDGNEELMLSAGDEIVFTDGFEASTGAEVEARIEDCSNNRTYEMINAGHTLDDGDMELFVPMEKQNSSLFRLYPNPTSNEITMEFIVNNIGSAQMVIYSMHGTKVYFRDFPVTAPGLQTITVPMSKVIPSGSYLVTLSVDNHIFSKKVIIR